MVSYPASIKPRVRHHMKVCYVPNVRKCPHVLKKTPLRAPLMSPVGVDRIRRYTRQMVTLFVSISWPQLLSDLSAARNNRVDSGLWHRMTRNCPGTGEW